jgi:hypothetical protein
MVPVPVGPTGRRGLSCGKQEVRRPHTTHAMGEASCADCNVATRRRAPMLHAARMRPVRRVHTAAGEVAWRPCTTCMRTSGRSASPPPFPVLRIGAATVWPCAQCRAVRPVTLGIAAPRCGGLAEFLRAATRTCLATEMELVKTTLGRNLEVQNYAHAEQCSDLQQEL